MILYIVPVVCLLFIKSLVYKHIIAQIWTRTAKIALALI